MSLPCLEWNNYIYYFEDGNIVNVFQYLVIFVTKVISISRKLLHSVEKQKNFFVVLTQLMIFMQLQNSTCKSFKISHLVIINLLNVNRLIINVLISNYDTFCMALFKVNYFPSSPDLEVLYRFQSETPQNITISKKIMDLTVSLDYWNFRALSDRFSGTFLMILAAVCICLSVILIAHGTYSFSDQFLLDEDSKLFHRKNKSIYGNIRGQISDKFREVTEVTS